MIELTLTDICTIVGLAGVFIGGYIKLKTDQTEIKAQQKADQDLHNQKMEQMEREFQYMRDSLQSLKGMVYKQNEELTKALHENSTAIRELKLTLEYIREERRD